MAVKRTKSVTKKSTSKTKMKKGGKVKTGRKRVGANKMARGGLTGGLSVRLDDGNKR